MTRLEKLELFIPDDHTSPFEVAFRQENVVLPRIGILAVGPFSEFMVPLCPNVTTIGTSSIRWMYCRASNEVTARREHVHRLIEAAGGAPKLTHFGMFEWWKVKTLEAILVAIPGLSSLSMEHSNFDDELTAMLLVLSRFSNLQYLALACNFSHRVTTFLPPWCEDADYGPDGHILHRRVKKEREKVKKMVVRTVLPVCRKLKVLWIGDWQKAEVRRSESGDVAGVTWTEN